ncbi:hypothetical protein D3C85_1763970 [compost metagenome]
MHQVGNVLAVESVKLGVAIAGAELRCPLVVQAGEVELIAGIAGDYAARVASGDGHVLTIGGVSLAHLAQSSAVESQAGELVGV